MTTLHIVLTSIISVWYPALIPCVGAKLVFKYVVQYLDCTSAL